MIPQIILPEKIVNLSGKTFHVNPYQIGDEKALLAIDEKNIISTISVLSSLVKKCIKEDIVIDDFHFGELLYIYLQIHSISVSEYFDFILPHEKSENEECQLNCRISINDIKFDNTKTENLIIPINTTAGKYNIICEEPTVGLYLKYDSIDITKDVTKAISLYIKSLVDETGDNNIELTVEDRIEIAKNLDISNGMKLCKFAESINRPYYDLSCKCPHCGKEIKERIYDFFI